MFTGILPVCRDEQGLAAVLGHGQYPTLPLALDDRLVHPSIYYRDCSRRYAQIATNDVDLESEMSLLRTVARHSAESYSYSKVLIFMALLLDSLNIYGGFSALLRTFLLELPRSRKQELEGKRIPLTSARQQYE